MACSSSFPAFAEPLHLGLDFVFPCFKAIGGAAAPTFKESKGNRTKHNATRSERSLCERLYSFASRKSRMLLHFWPSSERCRKLSPCCAFAHQTMPLSFLLLSSTIDIPSVCVCAWLLLDYPLLQFLEGRGIFIFQLLFTSSS